MLALLPLVLSLAPEIAKWLIGSKAQEITQQAVEVVQAVTGTSDPAEAARVAADPQKALELKIALAKIAAEAQAIEANERIETLKAEISDVANARAQTVALAQTNSKISWAAPIISIVIVLGFFLVPLLSKLIEYSIDQIWLGALIAAFANVGNYWLGSSASSKRAQEAVQNVAERSANQVNANAAREASRPHPAPVVITPPVAPSPAPPPVIITPPAVSPVPAPLPTTSVAWRRGPFGGVRWQLLPDGVLIEGEAAVARSVGEPVTVRKIWTNYGPTISETCARLGVPIEVVVAVIATESRGNASAVLVEPDGRASGGLMQILNTTASEVLKRSVGVEELKDAKLNIEAGVCYIHSQREKNNFFDPILTAACYNAGGLYEARSQDNNRFNLRTTGDHLERMIRWYGDACFLAKQDGWHDNKPMEF